MKEYDLTTGDPVSVSDYISILNGVLSRMRARIIGEVSEMKRAASGHVYFSLKDEKTGDIINCAIWRSIYNMCGVRIEDGMQLIITGSPDIYPTRGMLTFKVRTVELVGEGALKKAYDELKKKLEHEGLFDPERKRSLPYFPQRIGVITSLKGAAIHDFTSNLGRFHFKILACDSRVEGQEAVRDLIASVRVMRRKDIDLLVIIRGGGSLQSLMAFDNEMLVREVAEFPVPVIAGLGHHQDVTLVALACDKAHSTPTAAAMHINKNFERARERLALHERSLLGSFESEMFYAKRGLMRDSERVTSFFRNILDEYKRREGDIKRVISRIEYSIRESKKEISSHMDRVGRVFYENLRAKDRGSNDHMRNILSSFSSTKRGMKKRLDDLSRIMAANDPQRQLKLGYAIIRKDEGVIRSTEGVREGDRVMIDVFDGKIDSEVKKIKKNVQQQ